nr:ribosomal protein S1 [Herpetospermum pedunculosum]
MLSVAQGKGIDAKIIKPQWNGPSQVWDSRSARLPRHVDGRPDRCLGWGSISRFQ